MRIPRKMRRYPVQNHAYARFMHFIHEKHEIFCAPVTRSRSIISDYLISPGGIERVLHYGHQLNMGVAHLLYIINNLRSQFTVIIEFSSVCRFRERSQIDLIYIDRLLFCLQAGTAFHPFAVLPFKAVQIPYDRCAVRTQLLSEGVRICLHKGQAALGFNLEFVAFPFFHIG